MKSESTTIVALASASGRAGVNIIRISGDASYTIALKLTTKDTLTPRWASFTHFYDPDNHELIDQGLVIYFAAPASFTGEGDNFLPLPRFLSGCVTTAITS